MLIEERLEQRIARVHRMGQQHPVLVVHLLTQGSIEERVWETVWIKKELFRGLFDGTGFGGKLREARAQAYDGSAQGNPA